jgi:hypothetical protein
LLDPLCAACVCIPPSSLRASIPTEPAAPAGGPEPLRVCGHLVDGPEPLRACGPLPRGEPRIARAERSPLLAREESFGREMAGYFGHDFHGNRKGSFTCRKYPTRNPQLYFPSEGRHAQDFVRPEKNPTASAGFEPAILSRA